MTYDAIIESAWTQVGTLEGTIEAWDDNGDSHIFEVTGSLEPAVMVQENPLWLKVKVLGQWSLIEDDEVYRIGDLESWAIFEADWIGGEPHAGEIIDSAFTLTGYGGIQGNDDDQGNGDGNSQ